MKSTEKISPFLIRPIRYEITNIARNSSQIKEDVLNIVKVIPISHPMVFKISKKIPFVISCILLDENDTPSNANIDLIFFAGQPSWWAKAFPLQKIVAIMGVVKTFKNQISITHPQKLKDNSIFESNRQTTITPIYSKFAKLKNDIKKSITAEILQIKTPKNIFVEFESQKEYVNFLQEFYGKNNIKKVAVTGTNGKTSVVHFCAMLCSLLGKKSATIGTNGICIYEKGKIISQESVGLTTATLTKNHEIINNLNNIKTEFLFMEASSIGIHQGRLDGISFDISCFTNFTQDHLDYHKTMEEYFHQKIRLFTEFTKTDATIILNEDDGHSKQIANKTKIKTIFYSKNAGVIENYTQTPEGFELQISGKKIKFCAHGIFQVSNLACTINTLLSLGFHIEEIVINIPKLKPPLGRMESLNINGINIIIDYAHTPDALENILKSIDGNKILVFGCGGDRDKTKRPIMGRIATQNASYAVITSDNPRTENPAEIIKDIQTGIDNSNYTAIIDRKEAILHALSIAKSGDFVIIAGKGNECYQEINGVKYPFKDLDIVNSFTV